jgi:putative ABC transport system permease protein
VLSAFSQAWASWKTAPGVALLAVVAFAIGIGSATAIFTVVNGVMLQSMPYPSSERFVAIWGARTNQPGTFLGHSVPDLQDYEQQTTSFDAFGWFRAARFNLTAPGEPQFVQGAAVTPALARQLGPPILGQWFPDDTSAVISSVLWRRLGGGRDIIGSAITLDGVRYTVSGVMPLSFRLPIVTLGSRGNTQVWIPLDPSPPDPNPGSSIYTAYARRKPGVSLAQAQADVRRTAANIAVKDPDRHQFYTANVVDLRESTAPGLRNTLLILLGGAGLLLLIACANVATLLLARAVVRARETAIRVALGASRRQLALRYFAEGALVSVAGAAAGVGLSAILVRYILAAAAEFVPRVDAIGIDWKVLGFSIAVAVATGVLAGLAPLWQAMRTAPNAVLSEGVRASAGAPARRLSKAFVVAEIALAFTLLTTSAILVVHLRNLASVSPGFDPNGLVAFEVALPRRAVASGPLSAEARRAEQARLEEVRSAEQARLLDALRQSPGVTGAALANQLPPGPCGGSSILVEGRPEGADAERVCLMVTTSDFFSTIGIPPRIGRLLNEADVQREAALRALELKEPDKEREEPVRVVINEAAARAYFTDRNPIGATARFSGPGGSRLEIVGVVGDVRNVGLNSPVFPAIYLTPVSYLNMTNVVVRSDLPADQAIAEARRAVRQADPTVVMEDVRAMNDVILDTLQLERLSSLVMTFFGLAALLMATLGIYGVMSYFVRQRTVELGTRMALGAVNRDLVALVLGGGLKLSLTGVAVGSIAAIGGVWLLVQYLAVANFGWLPFAASTAVVGLVAAAAASVPAWRTTLISPMVAMREQPPSVWRWARQRMQRAARDVRQAVVGGNESAADVSAADVLTAFVDAARGADSYTGALRAVLASVCEELHVESAALLERRDGSTPEYRCLVGVGALETAAPVVAADGFLITRLRAYPLPLPFAPDELAALADWAAAHRPQRLDEIRALAAAGIRLAVPLRTRSEILGVLLLGERPQRTGFSAREKQVLRASADQFALMIENTRLTDRVVEQETLRRDIALASDVQRRLLPDAPPRAGFVDFAALSVPARHVGGDYYDFIELGDEQIGIALADVSGKGVAAALIMSVVQASLRIISSDGDVPLPRLVARMNQVVYRSTPASKYATFFYAQLDPQRRQLRYVNAGHNPPFLFRAGRHSTAGAASSEIEQLTVGGTIVGMFPEMDYEEATVELSPGDVLLVFSDGVPEAHNPEHEEFGEERLQQLLRQTARFPADEISARISAEMKNWIHDAEQYDDLTFIVMKVR